MDLLHELTICLENLQHNKRKVASALGLQLLFGTGGALLRMT